jgi:hypothetical protein
VTPVPSVRAAVEGVDICVTSGGRGQSRKAGDCSLHDGKVTGPRLCSCFPRRCPGSIRYQSIPIEAPPNRSFQRGMTSRLSRSTPRRHLDAAARRRRLQEARRPTLRRGQGHARGTWRAARRRGQLAKEDHQQDVGIFCRGFLSGFSWSRPWSAVPTGLCDYLPIPDRLGFPRQIRYLGNHVRARLGWG